MNINSTKSEIKPKCPRYQRCSAAICPLWKPVLEQKMLKSERVCGVLLEYQKPQSQAILVTHYGNELLKIMAQATKDIQSHGRYLLKSALERAAKTQSRLALTLTLQPRELWCGREGISWSWTICFAALRQLFINRYRLDLCRFSTMDTKN